MESSSNCKTESNNIENIRMGYQAATNLWIYEGTQIWSKFTAMVYANTIVILIIGVVIAYTGQKNLSVLHVFLCFLGLALCFLWYFLTKRSFSYYKYWIFSARELEEKLQPVKTISRGANLSKKGGVSFEFETGTKENLQTRTLRIEWIVNIMILVFVVMYILLMFIGW